MRLISWNVNGIRAVAKKGLKEKIEEMQPDILCFQETKAQDDQVAEALAEIDGFHLNCNSAVKKGYSGTAILSKEEPNEVIHGIGVEEHDDEGRVLTLEFQDYFVVTCYTPNSGNGLKRLDYREQWDLAFASFIEDLDKKKPVIVCGDLNVAHREIDLARPKANYNKQAGYTQKEIDGLDHLLSKGLKDSFREMHPKTVKYSWWSFRMNARARNVGWRIDYVLCSNRLMERVEDAFILNEIEGSDHCPVGIGVQ